MPARASTLISVFFAMACGVMIGSAASAGARTDNGTADERLPLADLRAFTEVFDRIRSAYVEEVGDAELFENAIRGMLQGLDPHSAYLDSEGFSELREDTTGRYGGVGIEVGIEDGRIRVIAPIDDTPAAAAGIQTGDVIVAIDGERIDQPNVFDAVESMRGEPGTPVTLELRRVGVEKPIEVELVRAPIALNSVRVRFLEDGYAYARISQFQTSTGARLREALERLTTETPMQGLVLDLRNNPGGVLQASVQVADAFLTAGEIVSTRGRRPDSGMSFSAREDDLLDGAPLVVLINEGSASASEIVAGALQDHRRGIVVGTRSFGKGSVQTVLPLTENRAIKLTTARYYTPNGRSIQAEGIIPDIVVRQGRVTDDDDTRLRESDLPGHLDGTADADDEHRDRAFHSNDLQLAEALNVLKGLHLYGLNETR